MRNPAALAVSVTLRRLQRAAEQHGHLAYIDTAECRVLVAEVVFHPATQTHDTEWHAVHDAQQLRAVLGY